MFILQSPGLRRRCSTSSAAARVINICSHGAAAAFLCTLQYTSIRLRSDKDTHLGEWRQTSPLHRIDPSSHRHLGQRDFETKLICETLSDDTALPAGISQPHLANLRPSGFHSLGSFRGIMATSGLALLPQALRPARSGVEMQGRGTRLAIGASIVHQGSPRSLLPDPAYLPTSTIRCLSVEGMRARIACKLFNKNDAGVIASFTPHYEGQRFPYIIPSLIQLLL